ncbi:MAG: glycoside hydrolase family 3 protein, partial [Prevotella sp.]|nr:glycoside hydrolase family 3 protein [Prevotella sp.]
MTQLKKIVMSAAASLLLALPCAAQELLPFQNPALSAEERANDLISRLTLKEKAKLMIDESEALPRLGLKRFPWWSEALHGIGRNGFTTVFPITMAMAASFDDDMVYRCFDAASDEARVKNEQAKRTGDIRRYQGLSFWTPNINI